MIQLSRSVGMPVTTTYPRLVASSPSILPLPSNALPNGRQRRRAGNKARANAYSTVLVTTEQYAGREGDYTTGEAGLGDSFGLEEPTEH